MVLVTGIDVEQMLAAPKLEKGTGKNIAESVYVATEDWKVTNNICGMCFDTTASNTGNTAGACSILEQKLKKELLYLACRHHIHEIILEKIFSITCGVSSGPEVQIFKRFRQNYDLIDKTKYRNALNDVKLKSIFTKEILDDVLCFALNQLQTTIQPRGDYEELLKLTVI